MKTKIGAYTTFTSPQAGRWVSESGLTIIEKCPELGSAICGASWWVYGNNGESMAVFHTLREALELRWD